PPGSPATRSEAPLTGVLSALTPTQSDHFELSRDPIEPLAGELAPAQCSAEVGPVQELRARCCQRRCDARVDEHLLHVLPPSAIDVAEDARGLGVVVRPAAHADFQYGVVSEATAHERIETLFDRVIPLEVGDDRFRCPLSPVLDHPGMKRAEVAEMPIEAAARDAELAGEHIRLQGIEALLRERCESEVDPVLRGQSVGHESYHTALY